MSDFEVVVTAFIVWLSFNVIGMGFELSRAQRRLDEAERKLEALSKK